MLLIGVAILLGPAASADPVSDGPSAAMSNAQDIKDSQEAYLLHLTEGDSTVKCWLNDENATGFWQLVPGMPANNARDVARWSVGCSNRLEEPPAEYELKLTVHFDYWENGEWVHMDPFHATTNTQVTCVKPSVFATAYILDCINAHTYPLDHEALLMFHRAHYMIVEPVEPDLHFYSVEWYSGKYIGP